MKFVAEPELQEYMSEKGMNIIAVEVVTSDYSDFEISELHVHLVNEKQAGFFVEKKQYLLRKTDFGSVLLPPFKLQLDETVIFGLKKFWIFKSVSYKGIGSPMK